MLEGYLQMNHEWFPASFKKINDNLVQGLVKHSALAVQHQIVSLSLTFALTSSRIKVKENEQREKYKAHRKNQLKKKKRERNFARCNACNSWEKEKTSMPMEELVDQLEGIFDNFVGNNVGKEIANLSLQFLREPEEGHWYRIKTELLTVFKSPEYTIPSGTLGLGARVFGIEKYDGDWLQIKYYQQTEKSGWIKTNYKTKTPNVFRITDKSEIYFGPKWKLEKPVNHAIQSS